MGDITRRERITVLPQTMMMDIFQSESSSPYSYRHTIMPVSCSEVITLSVLLFVFKNGSDFD